MPASADLLLRLHKLLDRLGGADTPLDPLSRGILLHVASRQESGEPLQLSDIRFNEDFGSPATALKRLQRLIGQGWLSATPHPTDGRAQLLRVTPKARRHISAAAVKILQLAARSGKPA